VFAILAISAGTNSLQADRPPIAEVNIGVFRLFHPRELTVSVVDNSALVIHAGNSQVILERSSGTSMAHVLSSRSAVLVTAGTHVLKAASITLTGRGNGPTDFVLAVAGRIQRRYHGELTITVADSTLAPIVTMDLETAVASVVAAESSADMPMEALKAQAVASRSYFIAGRGRHEDFDFCDTTHCQYLREVPAGNTNAAKAVAATKSLVLNYDSRSFAAMYTRSCSGRTHTPAELGIPAGPYPYYSVECSYCRSHPSRWSSRISSEDGALLRNSDEASRLELVRRRGSHAAPSNDFKMKKDGEQVLLEGMGEGHGIGLCQAGAKAMAQAGADYRQILAHYYPNTTIAIAK
jgi:peptidoglycan hydrolase-like amidase